MKIDTGKIRKILIIQYKPFGDVLLNTGYLPYLRKNFLQAEIDFLVRKPYDIVLRDNPNLNNLLIFEKKKFVKNFMERVNLIYKIRKRKYDLIIDQIRGTGSAQMILFSGARYRLGFRGSRRNWLYNIKPDRGEKRYYSRMKFDLLEPLGITEQPHNLHYEIHRESFLYIDDWLEKNELEREKIVIFSPGSPVPRKKWSPACYVRLGDLLQENTNFRVVLLGSPGERSDIKHIAGMMKTKAIIAPPTDFNQAGAILKRCGMLVCNDGGINHLAVAMETPSITIFGPTNPIKWAAWHKDIHFYFKNYEVDPAADQSFGVRPETVYAKILDFFNLTRS